MAGRVAPDMQNDAWKGWLMDKVKASLASFEKKTSPSAGDDWDMGDVALACALDFLSFRMPDLDWPSAHPFLSAWFNRVAMCDSFYSHRPSWLISPALPVVFRKRGGLIRKMSQSQLFQIEMPLKTLFGIPSTYAQIC